MNEQPPTIVTMRFDDTPLLWSVEDVYSPEECAQLVREIEKGAPTLATNNALYRDQDRVIRDDETLARQMFERLAPHLPATIGGLQLKSLNSRFRCYRYQVGQRFAPHTDHWYQPSPTTITLLSVLLYLNDDFTGGETRFMEQIEETVVPKPGLVAVFQHKIRHEGCPILSGKKYAMRTDVIYEAGSVIEKRLD